MRPPDPPELSKGGVFRPIRMEEGSLLAVLNVAALHKRPFLARLAWRLLVRSLVQPPIRRHSRSPRSPKARLWHMRRNLHNGENRTAWWDGGPWMKGWFRHRLSLHFNFYHAHVGCPGDIFLSMRHVRGCVHASIAVLCSGVMLPMSVLSLSV